MPTITQVRADRERCPDRLERAVAAADLDGTVDRVDDPLEERRGGNAVERAVEVDEVEADGAFGRVAPGKLHGIATLERYLLATPTRQAHHTSSEDVDRRNDFELAC